MKPKNVKERRNSFLKFLLLFLVTVATIVTAIFFTFKVPTKENDLLKGEAKRIKKEVEFQNNFSDEMNNVKRMIDSLNKPGTNIPLQTSSINNKLVDMHKMIPTKDSTYRYDMYQNIVKTYSDLQEAKDRLRALRDSEGKIAEYKEALEECRDNLKQAERDLDIARASMK